MLHLIIDFVAKPAKVKLKKCGVKFRNNFLVPWGARGSKNQKAIKENNDNIKSLFYATPFLINHMNCHNSIDLLNNTNAQFFLNPLPG